MRRTEHLGARVLTSIGLLATVAYLVWRVGFSLHDTALWLSLPALGVEIVGFLGAATLAWALWPSPSDGFPASGDRQPHVTEPVDVVVRVDQQVEHEVRSTLLALRAVRRVSQVVVVDLSARPGIAALATEFDAVYACSDSDDRNGLRVALATVQSAQFLLLDAGDIPTGDIVERLMLELDDSHTAVVQGMGTTLATDSAEHGPNGRHELIFERSALNPSLGRRGSAVWLGSGSLVRVDALREVGVGTDPSLTAHWLAGARLLSAGWRVAAPGDVPVVAHQAVHSDEIVAEDRVRRARAARHMVFGIDGALRGPGFSKSQRTAMLAWAVRPLSGLRRVAFLLLLGASILSGSVPFHATTIMLACVWLPAFAYTSLGLSLLSGWTLRPGDRTRWSLHSIGSACTSLRAERSDRVRRTPIVTLPTPQYGAGLVVAVVALSTVLVLRGVSDRVTHTLGTMPQPALMVLLTVSLWTLAISLDLLRVLARRNQMRRTARVVSSLAATLGERAVSIVDLTALGAGLISQTGADVNERMLLDSAVPTRTGVTTMRVSCAVRNVSALGDGEFRIGVEFGELDTATANALAEFCTIEPTWEQLGVLPDHSVAGARRMMFIDEPDSERPAGRMAVRLVSLMALVGAVASSAPTTVSASPSLGHRVNGVVVQVTQDGEFTDELNASETTIVTETTVSDTFPMPTTSVAQSEVDEMTGVPGVVVTAVCSLDAGADDEWGTADDVWDAPVSVLTDDDGGYELILVGEACWAVVSPPDDFLDIADGEGTAVPQPIDVSDATSTNPAVVLQPDTATPDVPTPPVAPSSIGDAVWSDTNRNGVQDAGEAGVAGVSLTLYDELGRYLADTVSDAEGTFLFDDLLPGHYSIGAANLPPGFVLTSTGQGTNALVDSDANSITGRSRLLQLKAGQSADGLDVGLAPRSAATSPVPTATATERVLPSPEASQVAIVTETRSTLSLLVLALAGLLALSILLGLARPRAGAAG